MRNSVWKLRHYAKITAIALLLNFWESRIYGEPLMERPLISSRSETTFYSDSEVESLIEDLSLIAREAIEQAGAEVAKAAALASIEREAELLRQRAAIAREMESWKLEAEMVKRNGRKNVVIGTIAGLLGGLALGITGTILLSR